MDVASQRYGRLIPNERGSEQSDARVPLGAVTIPASEVSQEERKALARKLYRRMLESLTPKD